MPLGEPVSQNENKFEDRAFSFVAPKLWSSPPDCVRNATTLGGFKKNLKTHLFQKGFITASELLLDEQSAGTGAV